MSRGSSVLISASVSSSGSSSSRFKLSSLLVPFLLVFSASPAAWNMKMHILILPFLREKLFIWRALTSRLHNLSEWEPATSFYPLHGHGEKFLWEIQKVWDNQEFFWMITIQDIQQTNIKSQKGLMNQPTNIIPSTLHQVFTHMKVRHKCLAMAET